MTQDIRMVLEEAFEVYPDAMIVIGTGLTPLLANDAARRLLDLPQLPDASFDGAALAHRLGGETSAQALIDAMNRAFSGKTERLDLPRGRGPEAAWWLSLRLVPVLSRDGGVRSVMLRVRESSTPERVEEALIESQQKLRLSEAELRSILESDPDLVISYNRKIEVLYFNKEASRAYRELLGVELRPGLCTYELFPAEHRPYWDRVNARVLGGEKFTEEFRAPGTDGHPLVYEVTYQPTWVGDHVIGFTTFGRNVTLQRRQEEALRQTQKLDSLGVLAGGVAHDFNNLLAVMLGSLELARRQGFDTPAGAESVERLEKAVLRASELTRQMLVYAGRGSADVRPHDLSGIVGEIAGLLTVSIPKTTSLRLQLGENLPRIQADAGQMQQVVMNLVTNAAEAIGDAAGAIRVTTLLVEVQGDESGSIIPGHEPRPGRHVVLEVADNGSGIRPEVLPRIFDPFFSTKAEGRGLGLCSMLGILRMHGAGLQVETEPDRGTTFRLYFPAAQETPTEQIAAPPVEHPTAGGVVLVADDEPWVLDVTCASLQALGYEVLRACDGQEAVEVFEAQAERILAVVLDASMPRMGGAEALRRIRGIRPGVGALLCSGYSKREVVDGPHDARTRFLQKPYSMDELAEALRLLVERAGGQAHG